VARSVLLFFLAAPSKTAFTTIQIARKLQLDYNAVWSALRRLRGGSLLTRVNRGFILAENRRVVAQAAYDAEGRPVPKDEEICSLSEGERRGLLKAPLPFEQTIALKPWRDIVAVDSGWSENTRITKLHLDPFIIKNIRTAVGESPKGRNPAQWLSLRGKHFTMQVSKITTLQFWVRGKGWRDELRDWLQTVPNLEERHVDQVWNKLAESVKRTVTTREFRVNDPALSKSHIKCVIRYPDDSSDTSMRDVHSHGEAEIEITGEIHDVDNVCIQLAGSFTAGAIHAHHYDQKLAEFSDRMRRESEQNFRDFSERTKQLFDSKLAEFRAEYEQKLKEKQLQAERQQAEREKGADYYG